MSLICTLLLDWFWRSVASSSTKWICFLLFRRASTRTCAATSGLLLGVRQVWWGSTVRGRWSPPGSRQWLVNIRPSSELCTRDWTNVTVFRCKQSSYSRSFYLTAHSNGENHISKCWMRKKKPLKKKHSCFKSRYKCHVSVNKKKKFQAVLKHCYILYVKTGKTEKAFYWNKQKPVV